MVIYYLTKYHSEYIFKSDLLIMVNQSTERSETRCDKRRHRGKNYQTQKKREYTKDLVAYELLKKISEGRTYLEVGDIIARMERQLVYWRDRAPCELAPVALDRYGAEITPPIAGTISGGHLTTNG